MNCDAAVYTPAAIPCACYWKENLQTNFFFVFVGGCFNSFFDFINCLFLPTAPQRGTCNIFCFLFLRFVLCFCFLCSPFPSSGLGSVLLACSAAHLSFLLSFIPHTFLQLLCQSLSLSNPSCVLWFHDHDCLSQLLDFFPAIFTKL